MSTVPIVFFGTPEFAVPTLNALRDAGYDIVAVVTQPDKPAGRGMLPTPSPIKKLAMELSIPVLQPAMLKSEHTLRTLKSFKAEVGVCVAYGKIIPPEIINIFPKGVLNIHPSLLPKYRGPSPIQAAIINGDQATGITIMLLDEEMDHGAILVQHIVPLIQITQSDAAAPNCVRDTGQALATKLAHVGAELLVNTLPKYLADKIKPQSQDHVKATFTKMLEREDGKINWNKPAEHIARMVRAYDLWPGTWTISQNKRLKILKILLLHTTIGCTTNITPGYVWKTDDNRIAVNCNPGSILLEQIQLEGKKSTTGAEFMRGHPDILQTSLQ